MQILQVSKLMTHENLTKQHTYIESLIQQHTDKFSVANSFFQNFGQTLKKFRKFRTPYKTMKKSSFIAFLSDSFSVFNKDFLKKKFSKIFNNFLINCFDQISVISAISVQNFGNFRPHF